MWGGKGAWEGHGSLARPRRRWAGENWGPEPLAHGRESVKSPGLTSAPWEAQTFQSDVSRMVTIASMWSHVSVCRLSHGWCVSHSHKHTIGH